MFSVTPDLFDVNDLPGIHFSARLTFAVLSVRIENGNNTESEHAIT
jgi:hypothetical protein